MLGFYLYLMMNINMDIHRFQTHVIKGFQME